MNLLVLINKSIEKESFEKHYQNIFAYDCDSSLKLKYCFRTKIYSIFITWKSSYDSWWDYENDKMIFHALLEIF